MCENSFSHMSIAAILIRGHPYISLPIGNDNRTTLDVDDILMLCAKTKLKW